MLEGPGRMRFTPITLSLLSLALTLAPALTSCVTPRGGKASGKVAKNPSKSAQPLPKEGQKVEPPIAVTPSPASPSPTSSETLQPLLARLSDVSQPLTEDDLRTAGRLHPAASSSLEEAVFVSAQLRLLKQELERSGRFQSRDLYPANPEQQDAPKTSLSLERFFQDLELDLPKALSQNAYLQTPNTIKLVHELHQATQNSEGFNSMLTASLQEQAQKWPELQLQMAATPSPVPPSEQPDVSGETGTSPDAKEAVSGPATATDLKRSDAILLQAQKAADKRDFKQAIELAARVESQDPLYEQAREKIRIFSNRAVQDLRQKAALAFQNALPMSDSRAKEAYLTQAKDLLEKALSDYPAADQLDTVRENLTVIKRDLDSIAKETAVESAAKNQ